MSEHIGRRYPKTIDRLLKRAIISHPVKHASLIRSTTCETILLPFNMFQFNDDQYMIHFEGVSCEMLAPPNNDPVLFIRDVTFHVESIVEEISMHCYNDFHFFSKPVLTIDGCPCPIVFGSRFPRVGFYQKAHGFSMPYKNGASSVNLSGFKLGLNRSFVNAHLLGFTVTITVTCSGFGGLSSLTTFEQKTQCCAKFDAGKEDSSVLEDFAFQTSKDMPEQGKIIDVSGAQADLRIGYQLIEKSWCCLLLLSVVQGIC